MPAFIEPGDHYNIVPTFCAYSHKDTDLLSSWQCSASEAPLKPRKKVFSPDSLPESPDLIDMLRPPLLQQATHKIRMGGGCSSFSNITVIKHSAGMWDAQVWFYPHHTGLWPTSPTIQVNILPMKPQDILGRVLSAPLIEAVPLLMDWPFGQKERGKITLQPSDWRKDLTTFISV